MHKDGQGLTPHGGILLDDSAGAASGAAAPHQPGASPQEAASPEAAGPAVKGGGAVASPSAGAAAQVTGSRPDSESASLPVLPAETGRQPVAGGNTAESREPAGTSPDAGVPAEAARPASATTPPPPVPAGAAGSGADQEAGRQAAGTPASMAVRTSGVAARPVSAAREPSLARVLATTISLWVSRRLRKIGIGRRQPPYPGAAASSRKPAARARSRTVWRWRLAASVLAVVIVALVALQLSGSVDKPAPSVGKAANSGSGATSSLSAAATARTEAADWIAQQVGSGNIIACDPVMCSALLGRGIPAGRLLPLQSAGANPFGADVIVASTSVRSEYGSELTNVYAPALIASFGSGAPRVDVRAIAGQGGAAYRAAEQPDLYARKAAGAQLLRNPHFRATAQAASQITAGQVDARLLVTLASLVSQRAVSVASFGDTGPGAPVQFRQVTITSPGGQDAGLTADRDQVHTQRAPYLPETATIVHIRGSALLRVEFGAPSVQGLLTGGISS